MLADAATARPERVYTEWLGSFLTLGWLKTRVGEVAGGLASAGIGPGDRVATMLPNQPDHVALIFALGELRVVWVPINPRLRGEGLSHQLTDCDPALLVVDERLRSEVEASGSAHNRIVACGPAGFTFPDPKGEAAAPIARPDDVVALMYTSGTTGPPKGVQVTDRMWQAAAAGALAVAEPRSGDRFLVWEPLCHIGGAQMLLLPLLRQVSLALLDGFHVSTFWSEARRTDATHIHHLGGVLQLLIRQRPGPQERDHRVRVSWGGGCDPTTWSLAEGRFGITVHECYGMTEISSIVTANLRGAGHGVGPPLAGFEIQVLNDQGGPVESGQSGEIVVRDDGSGLLTPGYFRRPDATAAASRNGWWHTGDRGAWDDGGCLHFLGRASDSIRRRGENVSAWLVERAAAAHPDVAEAAAVAVKSDIADEEILLYVTPQTRGQSMDPEAVVVWCRERLAPFEVPRYVAVVDALPKTASQRVAKALLSRSLEGAYDSAARVYVSCRERHGG